MRNLLGKSRALQPSSALVSGNDGAFELPMSIKSYPSDGGSLVMKSSAMHLNGCASGFVVIGNWGGLGHVVMFLHDWQRAHPLIYWVAKLFIPGHQ